MNIFILDKTPTKAAQYHCDKHVVKQIVETYQMLGSAVIRHGAKPSEMPITKKGTPLRGGYPNHPCTRWAGDSRFNFIWLADLGIALCKEYNHRYGKTNSCEKGIFQLKSMSEYIPDTLRTPFAIAISADKNCRKNIPNFDRLTAIDKYRYYYTYDKPFLTYTNRETPEWIQQYKKYEQAQEV